VTLTNNPLPHQSDLGRMISQTQIWQTIQSWDCD